MAASAQQATLVADTHVNVALPGVNSGAISNINVGGGYTGLLQFDLSLLPPGTSSLQISRAVLRLYVNRVDTAGLVSLQTLNSAWSEYGVTYQTLPAMGSAAQVFNVSQAGGYVAVDVTALVQGWVAAPSTNNGLGLTAGTAVAEFDSKENDLTAHGATLDVQLAVQGQAGGTGTAGAVGPSGATGPAGMTGAAGAAGANGAPGAAGPKGASGFAYLGAYDAAASYALSDLVVSGGSSYISLAAANRGSTPNVSPTRWGLIAAGGSGGGGLGSSGILFQGDYSSSTNYGLNDVVGFGGSSYISLLAGNHGSTPAVNSPSWGILAQGGVGTTGAMGPAGATGGLGGTGPQGLKGDAGAQGLTGPGGTSGTPGLAYLGAYGSTTNYGLGDVVIWQGSSYASLGTGNYGNTPSLSPALWGPLTAQGPQGLTGGGGAQGLAGPTGALGPVGPPGEHGNQGLPGIAGQAGAQGIVGAKGDAGATGAVGGQGIAGPAGLNFRGAYNSTTNYGLAEGVLYGGSGYVSLVSGNHGNSPDLSSGQWSLFASSGASGTAGAAGPTGTTGATGSPGVTGAAGGAGPQGPTGAQGPAVVNYVGNYASSANYGSADAVSFGGSTYVSLVAGNHGNSPDQSASAWAVLVGQGPAGATGSAGPAGPTGAVGPTGAAGLTGPQGAPISFAGGWLVNQAYAAGDTVGYGGSSYIAVAPQTGRQPDISPSVWSLLAKVGSSGPAGPPGATGFQGPNGATGATGPAGTMGSPGPAGPVGPSGATGATGPAGPTGPQGTVGGAGLVYRGSYASSVNYGLNDAVTFAGASYISLLSSNHGNAPDQSSAQWGVLGSAGAAGSSGPVGPAGQTGAAGAQGVSGAQGPAGSAGVAGFVYRGAWNTGAGYAGGDSVTFRGSTYLALASSSAVQPDANASVWALLAAAGGAGATGATGGAASVRVGTVTTGAAGSSAAVVNSGTAAAAVLDFTLPQGAAGTGGGGGGGSASTSGIPLISMYHAVSYLASFYSVNNINQNSGEIASVLSWVPNGCAATKLTVFSLQNALITVTMRVGTLGAMADSPLSCQVSNGSSCTATGSVAVPAGSFVDLGITHTDSTAAGVWSALTCN